MRLTSLLIFSVFLSAGLFSQTIKIKQESNSRLLVFSIGNEITSVERLKESADYFSDNRYGVPAFSFLLEGNIQTVQFQKSQSSNVIINPGKVISNDLMLDGTPKTSGLKFNEERPDYNIPLFTVNYLGNVNGRELTSIIIRPWKYENGSLRLQKNIELKLGDQVALTKVTNGASLFKKSLSRKSLSLSKVSASGFEKSRTNSYRLIIKKGGIAKISYSDILRADGSSQIKNANPKSIRIYNKGKEIPVLMNDGGDNQFGEGDFIEFFCEPELYKFNNPYHDLYSDPFTNENVYFLAFDSELNSLNKSTRMTAYSGENSSLIRITDPNNLANRSFISTIHFEENRTTSLLGQVDTTFAFDKRDHQFWANIGLNEKKSFAVSIPGVNSQSFNNAEIKIAFHGLSYVERSQFLFENNAIVTLGNKSLNDVVSGTGSWNGQSLNIVTYKLSSPALANTVGSGKSQIDIVNSDKYPNDAIARNFALNWIEVKYQRLYQAFENYLEFTLPTEDDLKLNNEKVQFTLREFSNPNIQIYKKGVGKIVNFSIESYTSPLTKQLVYRAIFQDFIENPQTTEYIALTESDKISPERIEPVYNSVLLDQDKSGSQKKLSLKNPDRDESFIIISASEFWTPDISRSFFSPIRDYSVYRNQVLSARAATNPELQGRDNQTLVTSIKDVYDEFNFGIKSPYAIRNFLDYAYHNWKKPPLYVLLVGDASGYSSLSDLVPTMMIQTVNLGGAPSDAWYGMVEGNDIIPDVHIGRIPASKIDQVSNYLSKLKKYESDKDFSGWRNNSLFISGFDSSFTVDNNKLRGIIDKDYFTFNLNVKALGSEADPFFGNRDELLNYWNNSGLLTVNFFGHGGGGVWDDQGLFGNQEVDALSNSSKLPFVTSMTCFTGNFAGGGDNLAEHLITSADKGAIGVLASSGVGWRLNDQFMSEFIYHSLFNPEYRGTKTIGELVDLGKLLYRTRYNDYWTYPSRVPNSMIHQYNLLGDPAVILKSPEKKLSIDKPIQLLSSSDSIKVNLDSSLPEGELSVKFADDLNRDLPNTPTLKYQYSPSGKFFKIPVPDKIKLGNKSGNMKFYLAGQDSDASGNVFFSYGKVLINTVSVFPEPITDGQYLKFSVQIDNKVPITSANLTYRVINEITADFEHVLFSGVLNLKYNQNGNWITQDSIPGTYVNKNYKILYEVGLKDNSSNEYGKSGELFLDTSPDVSVIQSVNGVVIDNYFNKTIGFYNQNGVKLGAKIYNISNTDAENVKVSFYENGVSNSLPLHFDNTEKLLGSSIVSIPKNSSLFTYIPVPPSFLPGNTYQIAVYAVTDTANGKREQSTMNNLSRLIPVTFSLFLISNTADSTVINNSSFKAVFKSTFNSNVTLNIVPVNYFKNGQDSLSAVKIKDTDDQAISISPFFKNDVFSFNKNAVLSFKFDNTVSNTSIKKSSLFRFEEKSQKWAVIANSVYDTLAKTVSADVNKFGLYKAFENNDGTKPNVTVSVDGRILSDNSLISKKANFSLIVQDDNGLIPSKDYFSIKFDGVEVDPSTLNIPDTLPDGNQMVITFTKEFSVGQHTISYSFKGASSTGDLEGNFLEKTFTVSDQQSVVFYGGFPNPFQTETVFGFKVEASDANRIRLKIFTVSGQLINTFDSDNKNEVDSFIPYTTTSDFTGLQIPDKNINSEFKGLYQIYWNGTDKYGNDVAYGVYYAKLIVDISGGKTIEQIFKSVRAAK